MTSVGNVREASGTRTRSAKRRILAICAALLGAVCLIESHSVQARSLDSFVRFDIKPQTLDKVLLEFARQAHVQIMFATRITRKFRTSGLRGTYTERQALIDLLRNSKLRFLRSGNTIKIVPAVDGAGKSAENEGVGSIGIASASPRGTGTDDSTDARYASSGRPAAETHRRRPAAVLQEVTVTGTHIAGGPPPSSPIITITRRQIQESGYQTVEQLMDSLPENFASVGSAASGAYLSSDVNAGNIANGAAVNLLGLGVDSTLVLVNGHRLAPSGTSGAFTDVSVIPLSAVKRVDIMTDGASAIYGADAIGGVVNYILRSHEQGAETSVEYGSVTHGGFKNYRASQSAGFNWSTGSAFFAYEFQKQMPLRAADRSFSRSVGPADLLAGLTQNSLYATATNFMGGAKFESDAFVSTRTGNYSIVNFGVPLPIKLGTQSTQYSFGIGSSIPLSSSWMEKNRVSYGGNDTHLNDLYGTYAAQSTLLTMSADASGNIVRLPSGNVKGAIGWQLRRERFSRHFGGLFTYLGGIKKTRTVGAMFAEVDVPLLPPRQSVSENTTLALHLAARYEHYSDFGSSFNPRAGLAWNPVEGLRIRGTVSTSFKPPNFYELYGAQYAFLTNAPDANSASGVSPYLELDGSNPNLKAERSTEWTAGFDLMPKSVRGLSIHATYFQIRFKGRIAAPNVPFLDVFSSVSSYEPFIQDNPSSAELNALTQAPTQYTNDTIYPGFGPPAALSDALVIMNNRLQNIGLTRVSGVNDTVSYENDSDGFRYHAGINTVYLSQYQNVPVSGAVPINVLNTLENPVNFRGRLTAGIEKRGLSFNGALNYVNHYIDPTGAVPIDIASWTTVDLQMAYRVPNWHWPMDGLQLALSCTNCLDRAPPAVRSSSFLFGYDPTNASPLGRFVSVTVRKRW